MPKLGLTMEEGTVVEWLKAQGDAVEQGEALLVLETDKIAHEVEAPQSGTVGQILVPAGTTVPTGTPIALILLPGEGLEVPPGPSEGPGEDQPAAKPKANTTPVARRLAEEAGLDIEAIEGTGPGGRVTRKDVERALASKPQGEAAAAPAPPAPAKAKTKVKASPKARRLAEEAGLDLASVEGTGKGGRVMEADVQRALENVRRQPQAGAEPAARTPEPPTPSSEAVPTSDVIPLAGVRGVIAQRMSASAHTTAPVTTTTGADATELVRLREGLRDEWRASLGFAPSYNDLLLVILAKALGEFHYMNARLVDDEIRLHKEINIGLAVDTERGLIVPVVPGVQNLLLADVARASRDLVERARLGKLLPDDLDGGTFTLSNMGMFDVEASTPIINLPECAILGAGRIAARPAVFNGELCVRQTMTLSLTYDHRAIDGAPAARFLERVKQLVEQPHLALVR
jgi:pyruvate dehydrogenase E2 component (dihydrolipoamide acetyltransferase)